jgi:CRISPR-associated protein Cas2
MPRDTQYLAVYDIADDKERTRVSRVLEGYGFRVQFSAFELRLSRVMRERLLRDLEAVKPATGFVTVYRLAQPLQREDIGQAPARPFDESNYAFVL